MSRVVVIGGGIAGLAAAYRLTQIAPEVAVTLIESDHRLGGKILTERVDGFVIEGGPDTFLSLKPRGLGLCRELGLENRLHGTNEKIRRTYVMCGNKLHELPEGLTGLIPSRFGPMTKTGLISPLGKLRMGLEYFLPPRSLNGDESLAAFVERRLGRELYDRLIEPLMGGIYAGDGEQLSLAATFPQLRQTELEYGGLIRGMLAAKKKAPPSKPGSKKWSAFLTPTTGLAEIVEALETKLIGVAVRVGTRVARVKAAPPGYSVIVENGEAMRADAVIFATPASVTADLISNLDSQIALALRAIPYVSTATVSVAYPLADIPRPLDGYGYIIPRAEGRPILACTWTSTKFPHRAPEGHSLIRAFVGRAGQEDVLERTDQELLQLVCDELRRTLGITTPPILYRIFRWPKAMPQYTLGHLDRLAVIEQRLAAHPGLFVAGNAYRGIGIPDCIASGEAAADKARVFLNTLHEQAPT
jgi:oxygen-dependent protoporphyrinogen oxidase